MSFISISKWFSSTHRRDLLPELLVSPHQRRACHDVRIDDESGAIAFVFATSPDKAAKNIAEDLRSQLAKSGVNATIEDAGTTSLGSPLFGVVVQSDRPLEIAKLLSLDLRTTQAIDDYERERILTNTTTIVSARRPVSRIR